MTRRWWTLAVVLGSLVSAGCAATSSGPIEVELADLSADHEEYDGQVVVARGVVRTFHDPRHYWIEDAHLNRVEIEPQDRIRPYLGAEVRVVGRFTARDGEGRRIVLHDLEPVTEDVGHLNARDLDGVVEPPAA